MQLVATLSPLRLATRLDRRLVERPRVEQTTAKQQAKRAGGPQDNALYTCGCGCSFTAEVTTSVGCPHCGTSQAW